MANTNEGWIKAWRKLATNKLWLEKPFSKGQAWIDLLMFATQNTHTSVRNGKEVVYEAGCVYESIAGLSKRWGWSRPRVYRFLEDLKNEGMIDSVRRTSNRTKNVTQCVTPFVTPLRIVNWELYQDKRTVGVTQNRTQNRTPKRTHPKNDIYPKNELSKEEYNTLRSEHLPERIEDIVPEIDLDGYPGWDEMPCEADGTKRDIPPRVRKLFDGDYGAYHRYMERMYGECSTKQN